MMGNKQKLITGEEVDLIYAKKSYCYLQNNIKLVKKIKRGLSKRKRREGKKILMDEIQDEI